MNKVYKKKQSRYIKEYIVLLKQRYYHLASLHRLYLYNYFDIYVESKFEFGKLHLIFTKENKTIYTAKV